ncbi:hypothetical protein [Chryseobacterium sp. MA9]|uniref:hypothetical protein n=1 Tax=Chryseobacterium sp. MA9 TaxID=2966625 RepID=UPI0021026191|nr:hypothetical protein [Chryseobacterium sp. MA9]UTX46976.1 hypothetical protein KIK00_13580 [Chryseobacterium sp. MA9]
MMTKKLFSWLLFVTAFSLMLLSCRNDYLPDQQQDSTINNAFRYTYKRISLEESKHKINLVPELKKINEKLKTQETYALGKAVKYSNGVSVNTDDVIYIERGTNVHSYTFHITRENTSPDAPLENLVLSSQPDGTYKELLITYNFTPQEKGILANGGSIETKGKLSVEELNPGTYSGGILNKSDISCEWIEESYYTACSEGQHFNGEPSKSQGGPCKAYQPSTLVTVVVHRCKALPASTALGDDGTGGGGGSFGGTGGNNNDTPTIPNLPLDSKDPCKKAKIPTNNVNTILHTSTISSELNALKQYAANDHYEYGTAIISTGTTIIAQDPYSNNDPNDPGHVTINIPSIGDYLASAHSHPSHGAPPPSVRDLYNTLQSSQQYLTYQSSFVFSSNGTIYAFVITDRDKVTEFLAAYPFSSNTTNEGRIFNDKSEVGKDFLEILENYMTGRLPAYSGNSQNDGLESGYAYILEKYNSGISLAKTDENGNLKALSSTPFEYIIPASGGKKITGYKAQPCP